MTLSIDSPFVIRLVGSTAAPILLNTSPDQLVLLREITKDEMTGMLAEFRAFYREWLVQEFCMPRTDVNSAQYGGSAPSLIAGLSGTLARTKLKTDATVIWDLHHFRTQGDSSLPSLGFAKKFPPIPAGSARTSVLNMPPSDQVAYLHAIVGPRGEQVIEKFQPATALRFAAIHLEVTLANAANVPTFLDEVSALIARDSGGEPARSAPTDMGSIIFLVWMHRQGTLLLPKSSIYYRWHELRSNAGFCFPEWFNEFQVSLLQSAKSGPVNTFSPHDLIRSARSMLIMSTLPSAADITRDLCIRFRDLFPKRPNVVWATKTIRKATAGILPACGPSPDLRLAPLLEELKHRASLSASNGELGLGNETPPPMRGGGLIPQKVNTILPGDRLEVRVPSGGGGSDIVVNTSLDSLLLLQYLSKPELSDLIRGFRHEQRLWLMRELCAKRDELSPSSVLKDDRKLIYGLCGSFNSEPGTSGRDWTLRNITLLGQAGASAIAYASRLPRVPGCGPLSALLGMRMDAQLEFLRHALGEHGEHVLESLTPSFTKTFGCKDLEEWMASEDSVQTFLERVMRQAVGLEQHSGLQDVGPALFLTYLRSRNVLLLPASSYLFRWNAVIASPLPFLAPWLLDHTDAVIATLHEDARTKFRIQGLQKVCRALWLMSSITTPADFTSDYCAIYRQLLTRQREAGGALSTLVDATGRVLGNDIHRVGVRAGRRDKMLVPMSDRRTPLVDPGTGSISRIIGPDSPHILACATREDDRDCLLNISPDAAVLLRPVSKQELMSLISKFRKIQQRWLMNILESPRREVGWWTVKEGYKDLPYGLSGTFDQVPRVGGMMREWKFSYLIVGGHARDRAEQFLAGFAPVENGTAKTALLGMTREQQLEYLHLFTGGQGEHVFTAVRSQFQSTYFCPELERWLDNATDVTTFLSALLPSLEVENKRRLNMGSAMFLAFLRAEKLLLLPTTAIHVRWSVLRGHALPWIPEWYTAHLKAVMETSQIAKQTQFTEKNLMFSARALFLTSTIDKPKDITDYLGQAFKDQFKSRSDVGWAINTLCTTTRQILGESLNPGTSALRRPGEVRLPGRSPFDWVRDGLLDGRNKRRADYTPRPDLIVWADLMDTALGLFKNKHLESIRSTGSLWLEYLNTLHDIPTGVTDVNPTLHIHDNSGQNSTLKAFLVDRYSHTSTDVRNGHLYRLSSIFSLLIDYNDLKISNPVRLKAAKFKGSSGKKRTVRSAFDPNMVELIRKINMEDDFAFSRKNPKHLRDVINPATGKRELIWFPAYAFLIDVLLQVPLRSHCGRYMDTGEGDELRYDIKLGCMVPNTSRNMCAGRQEGVIQFVGEKLRGKPVLGLHIAVNKTAPTDYEGRDIPYLPESLKGNLLRMREWAETYFPISAPVRAEADTYLHESRAPEVRDQIPTVYPLFRDPARPTAQPLSRELLMDYWSELCATVEDRVNAERKPHGAIMLTHMKGERRRPIFDIHSMRVTGITNMLKAGMPPDLVQQVVGHACLVMTMYYRDITMAELHAKLQEYYLKRDLIHQRFLDQPAEALSGLLFNLSDSGVVEEVRRDSGIYQRVWGPSWKVLAHGICPGGDCGNGGPLERGVHKPVRPTACSVCRHRLSGPAFLIGLVSNANLLLFQMRREAEALIALQKRIYALEDAGEPTHTVDGEIQQVRLRFEDYALEWNAEVQYVFKAVDMAQAAPAAEGSEEIAAGPSPGWTVQAEQLTDFHLLQAISTASELFNWRPEGVARAILERDEILNLVLDANGLSPLLLRMPKEQKLSAGNTFGELLLKIVPDADLDGLMSGTPLEKVAPPEVIKMFHTQVASLSCSIEQARLSPPKSGFAPDDGHAPPAVQ